MCLVCGVQRKIYIVREAVNMNKRNVWTRAMAFMLAMVMILTSQTVSSMGGTLGLDESQQQDVLSGEEGREQGEVQDGSAYDEAGTPEENSASGSQESTEGEQGTADQPTAGEPDGQETAQPVDLKDETTSIRVTGGSGILPADTVMTAEPLTILLHTQKRTKGTSTVFRQCWMTSQCIQSA